MSKEYITKYRIVNNPSYNDFNDELPYTIIAVDYDPKTDLIRQKGFNGWSKIGDKLYDTRQECEKHFVFEINYELDNNVADLQHRLEVAEKALELACSHIPCKTCPNSNGAGICYIAQDIGYYQPKENCNIDNSYYFKLKAEKEMKGE